MRDIERLTRQKLGVTPLPGGFAEKVAAIRALKPAERPRGRPSNGGGQRDHRPNRHPAHRGDGARPSGNRRRGNQQWRARG